MQSRTIAFLILVLCLGVASGVYMSKDPVSYGLDVRGGVRLTYRMDTASMTAEQKTRQPQIQDDLVRILQGRATGGLGVSEPVIAKKGEDSFVIELPGYTNIDEARSLMSSTAKVIVYWAKTVATDKWPNRRYEQAGEEEVNGVTYASFVRKATQAKVSPGTPEYKEMIETWTPILEGSEVAAASVIILGNSTAQPSFNFSPEGAKKLEAFTRKYINQKENIAFVLDNLVLSIAHIKEGSVLTDQAQIDGTFPTKYVTTLTELVKAGSLPVALVELSSEKVDPTIGRFALDQLLSTGVVCFAIIGLFLIVYYAFPGIVALIALILYTLFTAAALNLIDATFSLASIAALILSIGMAVDANILVFERFKEEMREGRRLVDAVRLGFSRALTAIVDSNVCTILTSLVLMQFGTGPVKGFATTLILGVALSLFTAIVVTRSLLMTLVSVGIGTNEKWYALGRNWFGEHLEKSADDKPLQVVENWKRYVVVSLLMVAAGAVFVALGGIKPNVEFRGGYEAAFEVKDPAYNSAETAKKLEAAGIPGVNIKMAQGKDSRIAYVQLPPTKTIESIPANEREARVADMAGFKREDSRGFLEIGPSVQKETVSNAIMGLSFSLGLIIVYLGIRFGVALGGFKNGLKFSLAAVLAVLQAVLVVFGVAAVLGYFLKWEISSLFLTAMLTVVGFQVHDTIVIFDRIRENLRKVKPNDDFAAICNRSVTQSFARSINTAATVVVTLLILIIWGTPTIDLKFFCAAMLTGILAGTYGSIFNATPFLWLIDRNIVARKGEASGLVAEAKRDLVHRKAAARATAAGVAAPTATAPTAAAGYGQVKRRSGVVDQAKQVIDEDEE